MKFSKASKRETDFWEFISTVLRIKTTKHFPWVRTPLNILESTTPPMEKRELKEWNGSSWVAYGDLDSISYQSGVGDSYRGKFFQLSKFYKTYDWIANKGSDNFGSWV